MLAPRRHAGAQTSPDTLTVPRRCGVGLLRLLQGAGGSELSFQGAAKQDRSCESVPAALGFLPRGTPAALPGTHGPSGQQCGVRQHPPWCPHSPAPPARPTLSVPRAARSAPRQPPCSSSFSVLCSPHARTSLLAPPPVPALLQGEACGHAGLSTAGCGQQQSCSQGSASTLLPTAHLPQGRGAMEGGEPHPSDRTPGEGTASGAAEQQAPEMCLGWWAHGQRVGTD